MTKATDKKSKSNIEKFSRSKSSVSSRKYNVTKRNKKLRKGIHNHLELNEDNKYKRLIKNIFAFFFLSTLFLATIVILFLIGITNTYSKDLPDIDGKFEESKVQSKESIIVDRNGKELYRLRGEKIKEEVSIDDIPEKLQWAFLATEDAQFWGHKGVNLLGLSRTTLCVIKNHDSSSCGGGSSITQQLVKLTTGENEKSVNRKAKEAIIAMRVEQKYTKKQILEYYLNNVPEGSILYGVKAGSKYLFGKENLNDLSLSEMAYLASITNEPTTLSPWGGSNYNINRSHERAKYVLDRMLQEKHFTKVTEAEIKAAKDQIPNVKFKSKDFPKKAPHYVDYVMNELNNIYADKKEEGKSGSDYLKDKGYTIVTAVDLDVQEMLENTIKTQIKTAAFQNTIKAQNAAGVVMDPKTGEILAMVGSADFYGTRSIDGKFDPQTNAATKERSLGSTMKPALYLTAIRAGLSPSYILPDKKMDLRAAGATDAYIPMNYSRQYGVYGSEIPMREALRRSLNVPAVYTYNLVGKQNYVDTYIKLNGYTKINDIIKGPSAVLGGANMPLLEQVQAYSTLAGEGVYRPKKSILEIKDNDGKVVYNNREIKEKRVIDNKYVYIINDMDKHYILFDYNPLLQRISKTTDIAGKTGTGDNGNGTAGDVAFMAYTPSVVIGMWAGNSCGAESCPLQGSAPTGEGLYDNMFSQFLEKYSPRLTTERFNRPAQVTNGATTCTTSIDINDQKEKKECTTSGDLAPAPPFDLQLTNYKPPQSVPTIGPEPKKEGR